MCLIYSQNAEAKLKIIPFSTAKNIVIERLQILG